jgi:hypothetical protein
MHGSDRTSLIRLAASMPKGAESRRVVLASIPILIGTTYARSGEHLSEVRVMLDRNSNEVSIILRKSSPASGLGASDKPVEKEIVSFRGLKSSEPAKIIQAIKREVSSDSLLKDLAKPKDFVWCAGSPSNTVAKGLKVDGLLAVLSKLGV